MPKYLYGIKNCSKCEKREVCNVKNDPKTLGKIRRFDKENRAHRRGEIPPPIQVQSYCMLFSPEKWVFSIGTKETTETV